MKTLFAVFLALIGLFTGGCSLFFLSGLVIYGGWHDATLYGITYIMGFGFVIALASGFAARALFRQAKTQKPLGDVEYRGETIRVAGAEFLVGLKVFATLDAAKAHIDAEKGDAP